MAFGARRAQIVQLVLTRSMILVVVGIAVGSVAAIFATRLVADTLFKVGNSDPAVFLTVIFVLLAISILSAIVPALRAAYVDPMSALREQ